MQKVYPIKDKMYAIFYAGLLFFSFWVSSAVAYGQAPHATPAFLELKKGWQYRLGGTYQDYQNIPQWALKYLPSDGWKTIPDITKPVHISKGAATIWYSITLPDQTYVRPCIYFEQIYAQSLTIYLDGHKIYGKRRNWARYDNKIILPLERSDHGKTLLLQAVSNLNTLGTIQHIYLGSHDDLIIRFFHNGFIDIILGLALALLATILIICGAFFLPKTLKKSWISLFLVVLILGIAAAIYPNNLSPYFPFLDKYIPMLIDTMSFIFFPIITYFFEQLFGPGYKLFIRRLWQTQFGYSLLCIGLLILNFALQFRINSLYTLFANQITAYFCIVQFSVLIVSAIFFAIKGDIDAKIFTLGFFVFAILSVADIFKFIYIAADYRFSLWKWGLLAFIISLVCILGRRIAENYRQVVAYSAALELKNQELNSMWQEIKVSRDQLADLNKTLEERVLERTQQLAATNEELAAVNTALSLKNAELVGTMKILQKTQAQLIESEKLAALGNLIAGITHEISTPIGAIQASIGNINGSLNKILTESLSFFQKLSPEIQSDLQKILQVALSNSQEMMTTREERQLRKLMQNQLQEHCLKFPEEYADMLAAIGIADVTPHLAILNHPESSSILEMVYIISGLRRNLQTIKTATDRTAKVVFALKSYTHHSPNDEMVPADIILGIETVLTLYQNKIKHNVTIIRNYEKIPLVWCYPDELNQVWTNVIDNALQAMDYQGILQIDVSLLNDNLVVTITDNGCGIPAELLGKIFNPFFTTKPQGEGSGMGLDIVKKIINKHKGKIEVNSIPHQQTTVRIFIPLQTVSKAFHSFS